MRISRASAGLVFWPKFCRHWPILTFIALGLAELIYFSLRGKGNDFAAFHQASILTLNLDSPWDAVFDPIYSAYVNGPLTAILISPLGIFTENLALFISRALSIATIPFLVFHISKYVFHSRDIDLIGKKLWVASSLIFLTFPVRANLEYGQFYLIFATAATAALRLSQSNSRKKLVCSGILVAICCDYKPQSFIIFALVICFSNRYILFGACFSISSGAAVSTILTDTFPYFIWIEVILKKLKGGSTEDQMHLYAVFPTTISIILAGSILILGAIYFVRTRSSKSQKNLSVIFVATLLSPWMHPTDLVFYCLFVAIVILQTSKLDTASSLSLGSLLVWSNDVTNTLIIFFVLLCLFVLHSEILDKKSFRFLPCILLPSIIFVYVANQHPQLEGLHRQFWGLIALVSVTALSFTYVSAPPKTNLSTRT